MQRSVFIAVSLAILLMVGLWLLRPTSPDLADDDGDGDSVAATAPGSTAARPDSRLERRGAAAAPGAVARRRPPASDGGDSSGGDDRFADRPAIAAAAQRARQHALQRDPGAVGGDTEGAELGAGGGAPLAAASDPKAKGQGRADSEIARAGAAAQERVREAAAAATPGVQSGGQPPPTGGPVVSYDFGKTTAADQPDSSPIVEQGVTITDAGAKFGADARFAAPPPDNFSGQAGSVLFWFLPEWNDKDGTVSDAALFEWRSGAFENRIEINKNGPYLRFIFADNTGFESGGGATVSDWKEGDWHHVGATWGDGVTTLFVDGVPQPSKEYNGEFQPPPNGYTVGSTSNPTNGALGARSTIRSFNIYDRALSHEEVVDHLNRTRPAK